MSLHVESVSDPPRITTLIHSASIFAKSASRNKRSVKNMKAFMMNGTLTANHVRAAWLRLKVATA